MMPTQPFFYQIRFSFLITIVSLSLLFILSGCPYRSIYSIDNEPQLQVDKTYFGSWETTIIDEKNRPIKIEMNLARKTDSIYNVFFAGFLGRVNKKKKPQLDTICGTCFMSEIGNRLFLNVDVKEQIFIAEFVYKNDEINLLALCEHFTNKMIKSNEQLKNAVAFHYRTRLYPLYDESFCLKNMTRIKKINVDATLK